MGVGGTREGSSQAMTDGSGQTFDLVAALTNELWRYRES
jgi:hypothetical protein